MVKSVNWERRAQNAVSTADWLEIYLFSQDYSELEARSINELAKRISNYEEAWEVAYHIYCIFKRSEKEWTMEPDQYCAAVDKARTIALDKMFEYAKFKYQLKDIIRFADYSDKYYDDLPIPAYAERAKQKLAKFETK